MLNNWVFQIGSTVHWRWIRFKQFDCASIGHFEIGLYMH